MSNEVLARKDSRGNSVLFIVGTMKNGQIDAWSTEAGRHQVSFDAYKASTPLEHGEGIKLANNYKKAEGLEYVAVRARLPKGYKEAETKPDAPAQSKAPSKQSNKGDKPANIPNPPAPTADKKTSAPVPQSDVQENAKGRGMDMADPKFASFIMNMAKAMGGSEGQTDIADPAFASLVVNVSRIIYAGQ